MILNWPEIDDMITIEECLKEQLFCSMYRGILYMTKKYNVPEPEKIWSEALTTLRELENKDRKDILILHKYGNHSSYETMTVLAVMFFMIIAKEEESYLTRTDLKDEMVHLLNGYGNKWNELHSQLYWSEDVEEKKNRFVEKFDYLEKREDMIQLTKADINNLKKIKLILGKCVWNLPASDEKIALWVDTMFGANTALLDDGDEIKCKKFRDFINKDGNSEGQNVSFANIIGYLMSYSLVNGKQLKISREVFQNEDQVNNLNKGKARNASSAFNELLQFMDKYVEKIINL